MPRRSRSLIARGRRIQRRKKGSAMSLVRVAASVAVFTLLAAAFAVAKPIVTTDETNLRKSPGTDSEVLTLIPRGTTVEVGKCTNGWCETSLDDKKGFAIAHNLGMAAAPRAPPPGPAG